MQAHDQAPKSIEGSHPIFLDVEMPSYLKCTDLVNKAIDLFNVELQEIGSDVELPSASLEYYDIFLAKKNGKPDDDLPSISKS